MGAAVGFRVRLCDSNLKRLSKETSLNVACMVSGIDDTNIFRNKAWLLDLGIACTKSLEISSGRFVGLCTGTLRPKSSIKSNRDSYSVWAPPVTLVATSNDTADSLLALLLLLLLD